jgi:hypothetical protein
VPGDDELLDLLAQALSPAPAEPSLAELTALQNAVRYPLSSRGQWRSRWHWRFDRRAIAALVGAGFLATSGTAFAVERDVPPPVRTVAHAIGLPVDSPQQHDARSAAGRLRHALDQPDDDFVRQAATILRSRLDDLPNADRRHVGGDDLLRDADERLAVGAKGRHGSDHGADAASGEAGHSADSGTSGDSANSGSGHGGDDQRAGSDTRHTTSTTSSFRAPTSGSPGDSGSSGGSGSGSDDGSHSSTTSSTSTTIRSGDDGGGSGGGGDTGGTTGGSGSGSTSGSELRSSSG